MAFLFKLLSRFPLWLLQGIGAALGWLTYALSPTYRRRFRENTAQAGYQFGQVRAAIGHAGRMALELPRIWLGTLPPTGWDGVEHIEAAMARGKGVIFLTPHLGCFECTAQSFAERFAPQFGALMVMFRPSRQPSLAELVLHSRKRAGLEVAPTTTTGVRMMIRALRAGRAVGVLPDQVPPEGMGVWAPFFGRSAYTMTLATRLAQQTGAVVLLAWGERLAGWRGYTVHVSPLEVSLDGDLTEGVIRVNEAMERLIRQCPQQYLWGYGRYKQPRAIAGH